MSLRMIREFICSVFMGSPLQRQALCWALGTQSLARWPLGGGWGEGLDPKAWLVREPARGEEQGLFSGSQHDPQLVRASCPPFSAQLKPRLPFLPSWEAGVGKLLLQMATE